MTGGPGATTEAGARAGGVVALVSGGLDSVTLAHLLHHRGHTPLHLLSVDYGQRHRRELDDARACAERLGARWDCVDLGSLGRLLGGSALTDAAVDVPDGHYADETMRITVVPNRNAVMLAVAHAVAVAGGAPLVAAAFHAGDHPIYPDCRPAFVDAFRRMQTVATEGFAPADMLVTPFLHLDKTAIVRTGHELGVPFAQTWSCYRGGERHCGRCGTCVERREAFALAGVPDPTVYEPSRRAEVLTVAEVFGPTLQGEGPSLGRRCAFVRLGGCNLDCSWCDTPYTWDWRRFRPAEELRRVDTVEVTAAVEAMGVDMLVITGGEPLLQARGLLPLLGAAEERGWRVEVETNGTVAPAAELARLVTAFNVSPKLVNSGVAEHVRIRPAALAALRATGRAVFKFVVTCPADLDEVTALAAEHRLEPVYVMPEGTSAEVVIARMRELAAPALARGFHLTPRLHILLWGDRRGR